MQKPENYKFPHLTTHPVMYLRINPATLLPSGGGGTLDGGQLIWTKKGFASDEEQLSALGFVEDFGMILGPPLAQASSVMREGCRYRLPSIPD